jgi:dihydrodipicolinate synthase/N-acetylneuraminate lyase
MRQAWALEEIRRAPSAVSRSGFRFTLGVGGWIIGRQLDEPYEADLDPVMKDSIAATRARLLKRIFPEGVPLLWCPPLTHYDRRGAIDGSRMTAHFRHLSPNVRGFLIPGSTGDGWELTRAERKQVLTIGLEQAQQLDFQVLIGALHPEASETLALIREDLDWLQSRFGEREAAAALVKARVCGFTICPPRGQQLTQEEISRSLASVLELGLPTAIYQLPQVTLNEMSPEVAMDLALRYENFFFFKDTSGLDAVVLSGKSLAGVFAARGAEGDYARWLKAAGGPYDGFLLSSANCFARELHQVMANLSAGRLEPARRLSGQLTAALGEVLRLAAALPDGNPFTNANKAMDHFFAHGPKAAAMPPPRLHAGSCLPPELIRSTGEILLRQELMPPHGYLEGA